MARTSIPGKHIEIFFADADRVVDVHLEEEEDPALAGLVIDAIERDDPDDAEQVLRDGMANGTVKRRP
jgi:hypothetical protein